LIISDRRPRWHTEKIGNWRFGIDDHPSGGDLITTVVGSYPKIPNLPRPAKLRKAIADLDAGKITLEELHRVEDEVTVEVLNEQIGAGLDLITDGKIRWEDEQTYLVRGLSGIRIGGLIRYFDTNTYYRQPIVDGTIKWLEPITVRDYQFAAQHASKPVKPALTGPYTLAKLASNPSSQPFETVLNALTEVLNAEARALEAAGAPLIQFDEPAIVKNKCDWDLFAAVMRRLTQGLKVKTALYTYFGDLDGLYPQILDLPFNVIGLDFVQGAKNWDVVPRAPFSKELGFGIVNARNSKIETEDELHRAFERIARHIPPHKIYVNPTTGLEFLPRERAQEKLQIMVAAVRQFGQ
jgi:5-methyltetrahydropteroyltriglutamate--homocysteine methyltransferase